MKEYKLTSEPRDLRTKSTTRKLRAQGKIPAVYYFHQQEPVAIAVDAKTIQQALHSGARIFNLQVADKHHKALIKEIQYNPVTDQAQHIDFMGVNLSETIHYKVPINITGIAIGVKDFGGVQEQHLWELEIKCRVSDIPEDITLDISTLGLGDSIFVHDIQLEGVEILTPGTSPIVSIVRATGLAVAAEEEAEEEEVTEEEGEEETKE
jgi:large subunit ribosomal protein L25